MTYYKAFSAPRIAACHPRMGLHGEDAPIYRIVLTGGPCAGKTTAMKRLRKELEKRNFRVFTVPEAATLIISNGFEFRDVKNDMGWVDFQTNLARLQMRLEDTMVESARMTGEPCVILCDRGLMDGKAYVKPTMWAMIAENLGATPAALRDTRYDAVFHLVTAAKGAEDSYSLVMAEGAGVRHESVEEARAVDERTAMCYTGHPRFYMIDNSAPSFEGKIQRVVDRTLTLVGMPPALGAVNRKFAMPYHTAKEIVAMGVACPGVTGEVAVFDCETTYIGPNERVLMRYADGMGTVFYRQEVGSGKGRTVVREQQVSARTYMGLVDTAKAEKNEVTIQSKQAVFLYEGVPYEVNIFSEPRKCCILEVDTEQPDGNLELPSFIGAGLEVTTDRSYDTRVMAHEIAAKRLGVGACPDFVSDR